MERLIPLSFLKTNQLGMHVIMPHRNYKQSHGVNLICSGAHEVRPLTVAGTQVGVVQAAVFAQTAHNDGDTGEEEHQADDDASHHQRGHQQAGFITPFLAVWVFMSMTALVWTRCIEEMVDVWKIHRMMKIGGKRNRRQRWDGWSDF